MAQPYRLPKALKDKSWDTTGNISAMPAAGTQIRRAVTPGGAFVNQSNFYDSRVNPTTPNDIHQSAPLTSAATLINYGNRRWEPSTTTTQPALVGSNPFNIHKTSRSDTRNGIMDPSTRDNELGWIPTAEIATSAMGQMDPSVKILPAAEEYEPPLLDELGINPEHILQRMKAALFFYKVDHDLLQDCDLCGPLVIAVSLGFFLLLAGKPTFGYIYGLGIIGCLSAYLLLNLMCQTDHIGLYKTMSILGYGLLPVVGLAGISIFFPLRNLLGSITSIICILWCTATASRFFETALAMHQQRFLVAYPIGLLYASFVVITVF